MHLNSYVMLALSVTASISKASISASYSAADTSPFLGLDMFWHGLAATKEHGYGLEKDANSHVLTQCPRVSRMAKSFSICSIWICKSLF